MYFARSLRVIAPAMIGSALAAFPASTYAAAIPARTVPASSIIGMYRLTLIESKTRGEQTADLILERDGEGYTALLLIATHATALEKVTFDGETLRAGALTSAGHGDLVLHCTEQGVTGTLTVGTHTITVKGDLIP